MKHIGAHVSANAGDFIRGKIRWYINHSNGKFTLV